MNTPSTGDGSADPAERAYGELLADLTAALPLDLGLTAILAGPPEVGPGPRISAGHIADASANEPHHRAYADFVADLEIGLNLPEGLANILDTEGMRASLVDDLVAVLNTPRGLSSILAPDASDSDTSVVIQNPHPEAGTRAGRNRDLMMEPDTVVLAESLAKIQGAQSHQRILLRTSQRYRYLERAMHTLHDIRDQLERIPSGQTESHTRLDATPVLLAKQHALLAMATAALASALPVAPYRSQPRQAANRGWETLTEQELRIVQLVGRALTNSQIAVRVGRSRHTVNYHLRQIFRKLEIRSRVELAALARSRQQALSDIAGDDEAGSPADRADIAKPAESAEQMESGSDRIAAVTSDPADLHEVGKFESHELEALRASAKHWERLLQQSTNELNQLSDQLHGCTSLSRRLHQQCADLASDLALLMQRIWDALSDFQGADLRSVNLEPWFDDLDGVRWSDSRAAGLATEWPSALRNRIVEHSIPEGPETGVFVIRFGAAIGGKR